MIIKITQEDINSGCNPIECAILRQYGKNCMVDRKFLMFKENRFPFRLPFGAEIWIQRWFQGKKVEPFHFEIGS